jgi:hypothetical protein
MRAVLLRANHTTAAGLASANTCYFARSHLPLHVCTARITAAHRTMLHLPACLPAPAGYTVHERLIPVEPMAIIFNLAMSGESLGLVYRAHIQPSIVLLHHCVTPCACSWGTASLAPSVPLHSLSGNRPRRQLIAMLVASKKDWQPG